MHINDTHHAQAIALLHEVCEALGIEPEKRTREEIRKRLALLEGSLTQLKKELEEQRVAAEKEYWDLESIDDDNC